MDKTSETMSSCALEETLKRLKVSEGTTFPVSLFRSKASGKLLFLEARKDFVDAFLSFLLLPVGTIIHMLTKGVQVKPVAVGISSVFESVQNLSSSDLQVAKEHLVRPRPAAIGCSCRSSNLPMLATLEKASILPGPSTGRVSLKGPYPVLEKDEVDRSTVGFVQANCTFIVTDNLEIMPLTTIKNVLVLSKLNVDSLADLESNEITVSLTQILQLLHSALTSNTCLNEVFGKSMVSVALSHQNDEAENSKT